MSDLDEYIEVGEPTGQFVVGLNFLFEDVDLVDDFAGVFLIVPEVRRPQLFFAFFELFAQGREVKDTSGARSGVP